MSKFVSYLRFFLSGLAFGIANVIPGVSGGTMLVVFGIYDKLTEAISGPKAIIKNIGFLIGFALGAGAGILGFAFVITYLFENFGVQTNMFFIGLILGSVPLIIRTATAKEKFKPICILPFMLGLAAVVGLTMLEGAGTSEPYAMTLKNEVVEGVNYGIVTVTNNSDRDINNWTIELLNDKNVDPKTVEGADAAISHSTMQKLQKLFGGDVPDNFNAIKSSEDTTIPAKSEYTFSFWNDVEITEADMELTASFAMDVPFFLTMLAALFIAAVAMIIPGVSGSFVMMLLGVYSTVIAALKDLDFLIIIPCAIGAILGIVLGARLMSTLLKKHGLIVYSLIMGLVIGSVYAILPAGFGFNLQTGYGFVALISGVLLSTVIDKIGKDENPIEEAEKQPNKNQ